MTPKITFSSGFAEWFPRRAQSRLAVVLLAGFALFGCGKDDVNPATDVSDAVPPTVSIGASQLEVTAASTLMLTAEASDDIGVTKVVFAQDGQAIGEDAEAPYTFDVNVTAAQNGQRKYSATAFDAANNQAIDEVMVTVAIEERFFGTAPHSDGDYPDLLTHFNQITPGNASKWGTVEGTQDEMVWTDLNTAYQFAKDNGILFKFHTLIWGNQAPSWIDGMSTTDQLKQITEWMDAVAALYPDLDLIDVVNEPVNKAPSFKDALGGDNDLYGTGWDWVIKAFEMARARFPNAKLILNEYNLLVLEPTRNQYLTIVGLLEERGLIDAIGEQGHFLERTDLSDVQTGLDALAATGLPIYISELELDFTDDNQQANRMRDLFPLFWEHPAVAGVTHWGYREGSVWDNKPNGYLVRADGSSRPALDWLHCYLAGNYDCIVDPFVPLDKEGGDFSINLPAAEYDAAKGLIASGSVIAYTDEGDWVQYSSVVFKNTYNTIRIRYGKGAGSMDGYLTVHLDSLENESIARIDVTSTGDWNTFTETEVLLTAAVTPGKHDVFIQFHEGEGGVANVQAITFGTPLRTGDTARLDIAADSYDVAQGVTDLAGGSISVADAGSYVVYSSVAVRTYREFSAAYTTANDGTVEVHVGAVNGPVVATLATPSTATEVTTDLSLPSGVYDLYVVFTASDMGNFSSFSLLEGTPGPNILEADFEVEGVGDWGTWKGALEWEKDTDLTHNASAGSMRNAGDGSGAVASHDLTSIVTIGAEYQTSVYVTIRGVSTAQVNAAANIACGTVHDYPWLTSSVTVNEGVWVELAGVLTVTMGNEEDCAGAPIDAVSYYIETGTAGATLYVDDVVISP